MSAGTPIQNFDKATTIPDGSLHLVEMGDGSGTKTVTQETLAKETGKALKIGDLAELQTENKENLVKAINEAAQSGGGGASVDILDSKEEIEANTEPEKAVGALAVKEMFSELNDNVAFPDGIKFYPDVQNGVRGYNTDPQRGADTFCPFSQLLKVLYSGNSQNALSGTYTFPANGTYTIFVHTQCPGNGANDSVACNGNSANVESQTLARYAVSGYTYQFKKHLIKNAKKNDIVTIKAPSGSAGGSGTCFIFSGEIKLP